MSKLAFVNKAFRGDSRRMIDQVNSVIDTYQALGLRLTLRQIFYQLVTRNLIRNTERAYKNLGGLVSDGRLAGLIDWDMVEDRIRRPVVPNQFNNLEELVDAALASYRLPRWGGQENYVELWVEKDALSGVLAPLANEFHAVLMVNRGYSSQSAMYDSYRRFRRQERDGKHNILLYLGDHDPSGEDMLRDIQGRFDTFGVQVSVEKIALTIEQVQQYNPPPNPAKVTDSRFERYASEFGDECWEVDALPPDVLDTLVRDAFQEVLDEEAMEEVKEEEERDKELLKEAVANLRTPEASAGTRLTI